jgi:predicted dienelactone hydrolase
MPRAARRIEPAQTRRTTRVPAVRCRRPLAAIVSGALLASSVAACGSDDDPEADADPDGDTSAEAGEPDRFTERGPYEVGSVALELDDGRRAVAWYPADPEAVSGPTDAFDIAGLLSPGLQAQIPPESRPEYPIAAYADAAPATEDGPYPVVLFSHGFAGFPEQSADLTTHLASWGFVVAAPDHVERSLSGMLGTAAQGVEPREDAEVLAATLDLIEADSARAGSPLAELVDLDNVAVTGHSAGAGAAYELAGSDDRIDSFIGYSVGRAEGPAPEIPGMVMLGTADGVIPADATREVYDGMTSPKYLVEIAGAGHLVFSDICLIGADGGGVIAIAESLELPIPDDLKRLGTDGCGPESTPPADAFPAIDDLSVAFLRQTLLGEDEPAALDPAVTASFDVDVTLVADG